MSSKDIDRSAQFDSNKLFDEITRLLATPMPRRQALKLAGITLTSALLTRFGINRAQAQSSGSPGPTVLTTLLHPRGSSLTQGQAAGTGRQVGTAGTGGLLWTGTVNSAMALAFQPTGVYADQIVGNTSATNAVLYDVSTQVTTALNPAAFPTCQVKGVCAGQQVGYGTALGAGQGEHALLWQGTAASAVDLHPITFDRSLALAISSSQQAGYGLDSVTANVHALVWQGTAASATDIHPAAYDNSYAYGVSATQIVGSADGANINYVEHAMLWTNGSVFDLNPAGFSSSRATATNGARQVGWGVPSGSTNRHALIWFATAGTAIDLHTYLPAGFTESMATGTDQYDNVIGSAQTTDGVWQAVLWQVLPGVITNHGGNTGQVTVQINSAGDFVFSSGTTAALVQPNITGQNSTVLNPAILQTTFDLTTARPGVCDILLTFPDGSTKTLFGAFTVDEGGAANVEVNLIGQTNLRAGPWQPYNAMITNTGNIDSGPVELRIQIPNWFMWRLPQNQTADVFVGDHSTSIGIQIPVVPAEGAVSVPIQFQVVSVIGNAHRPFNVQTWLNSDLPSMVIYVGDLTEPRVLRAVDLDGNILDYFGAQDSTGNVSSLSYATITANNGDVTTIQFDGQNRPIQIQASDGSVLTLAYGTTNVIVTYTSADGLTEVFLSGPFSTEPHGNLSISPLGSSDICQACRTIEYLIVATCIIYTKVKACFLIIDRIVTYVKPPVAPTVLLLLVCTIWEEVSTIACYKPYLDKICNVLNCKPGQSTTPGDPNDIQGVVGYGAQQWIPATVPVTYGIYFVNEPTASASAQTVVITNQLDLTGMDIMSFSLGEIGVGNNVVTPLPNVIPLTGTNQYSATMDLRPANNVLVNVTVNLNPTTGLLTWTFTSIDPATGLPVDPSSPNGFLPPDTNPPYGEGHVLYTIGVNPGALTGYQLNDQASIVFDYNAPVPTSVWFNTVDNTPPVSAVSSLPAVASGSNFLVSWTGTDIGSGVMDYTIYVSDNGGPYTAWLTNTTDISDTFSGQSGHTYAFFSQARDNVLNVEPVHLQLPDAMTTTPALTDVTSKLQISISGLTYNSAAQLYTGTITIKNNNRNAITGPLQAVLMHLPNTVTLINADGTYNGAPYVTDPITSLAPRGIAHFPVQFTNTATNGRIGYSVRVYEGNP